MKKGEMKIVEGISGTWHYHLSDDAWSDCTRPVSLCGEERVMRTSVPLRYWNKTPQNYHIPESWCETCDRIAKEGEKKCPDSE